VGEQSRRKDHQREARAELEERALKCAFDAFLQRCHSCTRPIPGRDRLKPQELRELGEGIPKKRTPPCPCPDPGGFTPASGRVCFGALAIQHLMAGARSEAHFGELLERFALRLTLLGK
jgi:hypothetical protein